MSGDGSQEVAPDPEGRNLLAVARLHRPHGLRGEVRCERIAPEEVDFEALLAGRRLWLRQAGHPVRETKLEAIRRHGAGYLIVVEGIEDRTAAQSLRGGELCLARNDLPEMGENFYWEDDLIGLRVVDRELGALGAVTGLQEVQGRWLLRLEKKGGGEVLIPWVKDLVDRVDRASGTIGVNLPLDYPGLS